MIRRSDPCPCGSGRKFKKCCWLGPSGPGKRTTGEFGFEPGSLGVPGGYIPSLVVREVASRTCRLVLVNPSDVVGSRSEAVERAAADFGEACRVDDATGSAAAMGRQLSGLGYVKIEDPQVVDQDA